MIDPRGSDIMFTKARAAEVAIAIFAFVLIAVIDRLLSLEFAPLVILALSMGFSLGRFGPGRAGGESRRASVE